MKKIIYCLAFIHLILISIVIFHGLDAYVQQGRWERYLGILCSLNYSVWRYGFFSPDVGISTEVEMRIYEDGGEVTRYTTLEGFDFFTSNSESDNRFYGFKRHTSRDPNFQDLSARSVATHMLNVHANAWRIDYTMRSIRYPTMDGYRNGESIRNVEFYSTTFVLR